RLHSVATDSRGVKSCNRTSGDFLDSAKRVHLRNHPMGTSRRAFIQAAGAAGAVLLASKTAAADDAVAPPAARSEPSDRAPFTTELFLDNQLVEATPGVARRLHTAKKH